MRISDWSSDVCSSDLERRALRRHRYCAPCSQFDGLATSAAGVLLSRQLAARVVHSFFKARHPDSKWGDRPDAAPGCCCDPETTTRLEEHTSELQSLMRISHACFGLI